MRRLPYILALLPFALLLGACEEEKPVEEPVEPIEPAVTYELTELEGQAVIYKPLTGDYKNFGDAVEEGFEALKAAEIELVGPPRGIFFDDPTMVAPDEQHSEVLFPVAADTKPPRGYAYKVTEPCKAVKTVFKGEFTEENMPDYGAIYAYIAQEGLGEAGPVIGIYYWDPELDPAEWVTEIYVPVKEPEPAGEVVEEPAA